MIAVQEVSKYFGDKQVLFSLNLHFEPGKVNMIIGKSGSGKTVLLKSLVGLHGIDAGKIMLGETDFHALKPKEKTKIRQEMGMLFQGSALFDSATILENVLFPLDLFTEQSTKEKKARAQFCLERVNLKGVEKMYPAELSGGMQKRAAIARAIALNPRYLFCDEPNSGLDPQTAIVIDKLIQEITYEYNMTTVVNSHDMNSALEIGDELTFLHQGKVWWQGTKEHLLHTENAELQAFLFSSELMRRLKV